MGYLTKEGIILAILGFLIVAFRRTEKAIIRENKTPLFFDIKFWITDYRNWIHLFASIPAIIFILYAGAEGIRFVISFSGVSLEHDIFVYGEKVICFLIGGFGDILLFKAIDFIDSKIK